MTLRPSVRPSLQAGNRELTGIGFPFYPNTSSCRNRKPSRFGWTQQHRHGQPAVYFDNASPYYGLIGPLRLHHPDIKLIATNRSKESWLTSIKDKYAGGAYLRETYGNYQGLDKIYDSHDSLVRMYHIPKVNLEDTDAQKIAVIHGALGDAQLLQAQAYCHWDDWDRPGFKNSVRVHIETCQAVLASC